VIADQDPFVGRALDLFVPHFDATPDELLLASQTGAARIRGARRRRQTALVVAFAALLLFAGAAFAAQKYDLLPFLHTNDRNSARFAVSPTRTYHGAAPTALTCPDAREGRFVCQVSGPLAGGRRTYQLGQRTNKVPLFTRHSMLAALDHAEAQGADPSQVARVRSDLADVGDSFIHALAVLSRFQTVGGSGGSTSQPGTERVPPHGVPSWTACREVTLTTYRCRPLAALVGVASGTPLYYLQPSRDWRTVAAPPLDNPNSFWRQFERLLGRKPNAAETRFFIDLSTIAVGSGSSSGTVKGTTTAVSDPRGAALLAPQSLGVRTRAASATALALPHRRLPGGLTRSETRLYRVTLDVVRGSNAGRHTLYVYVGYSAQLHVWRVVWVATKP
jgi:hypothetical protein